MKIRLWLGLFLCLFVSVALAQDPPPLAMLQSTSQQMLNALKQNKANMKSNPSVIYHIVDRILLPHVDLDTMSRSVVGRTYWNQATPAQLAQFKKLFTHQVVQTYSTALQSYNNEQVKFSPMRAYSPGESRVQVQSTIVRANGQAIPVNYRLLNVGGSWKVYDFSVEGVSLVQSYQAQFADTLSQGGMTTLLSKMQQRYGNN